MQKALDNYRDKISLKMPKTSHVSYKIGEKVLVFSPKTKRFVERGTILGYIPNTANMIPTSYTIQMGNGTTRVVNQAWLSLDGQHADGGGD